MFSCQFNFILWQSDCSCLQDTLNTFYPDGCTWRRIFFIWNKRLCWVAKNYVWNTSTSDHRNYIKWRKLETVYKKCSRFFICRELLIYWTFYQILRILFKLLFLCFLQTLSNWAFSLKLEIHMQGKLMSKLSSKFLWLCANFMLLEHCSSTHNSKNLLKKLRKFLTRVSSA